MPGSPMNEARWLASRNPTRLRRSTIVCTGRSARNCFSRRHPSRVVGPGQPIRVRRDSRWCVPEPELALVLSPRLALVGFTIGNDVSARDIEGENPLYLPQAKVYDACCALGPAITLPRRCLPARDRHPDGDRTGGSHDFRGRNERRQDGPRVSKT